MLLFRIRCLRKVCRTPSSRGPQRRSPFRSSSVALALQQISLAADALGGATNLKAEIGQAAVGAALGGVINYFIEILLVARRTLERANLGIMSGSTSRTKRLVW